FVLGAASGIGSAVAWRRWGKRLRSSEWVTPDMLARRRWVRGVVTSVGDADNFRLYHTPGIGWRWPLKFRRVPKASRDLKDQTIHIRIAGVDAPEGAHFGRPSQPYAEESLAWLKNRIAGRTVHCQLIRKDQYGRIVGVPLVPRRFIPVFLSKSWGSPLAFEMLRAGTVATYEQAGAEYGPWGREAFLRLEAEARAAKRGMWNNDKGVETPAEYKRRHAAVPAS
ncbi:staphylococcal nuclease, partial [Gyrodon lividus]